MAIGLISNLHHHNFTGWICYLQCKKQLNISYKLLSIYLFTAKKDVALILDGCHTNIRLITVSVLKMHY